MELAQELAERLDRELDGELHRAGGDGPAHRPLAERLTAGRRAVRRRRVRRTAAGSVLAVSLGVAVVGGLPRVLGPDTAAPAGDAGLSADEPGMRPQAGTTSDRALRRAQLRACGVELSAASGRRPRLAAGARVVERVEDPVPTSRAAHSVALDVRLADGRHRWVSMGWSTGSVAGGCDDPAQPGPFATFADFVAGLRADGNGMQL